MKIISGEWVTNGRTVYTRTTDTRSRHPGGQQAILSIAEGWSDREAAMFCERIVAIPEMVEALEYAYKRLLADNAYVGDPLLAKVFTAIAKAKGQDHATPTA